MAHQYAYGFDHTAFSRGYHTIGTIMGIIDDHFNAGFNASIKKLVYHAHKLGYVKQRKDGKLVISGACVLAILGMIDRTRKARVPAAAWHVYIG